MTSTHKYVFMQHEDDGATKLYFADNETGDITELKWSNDDYITNKLSDFNVKSLDELDAYFKANPDATIYEYHYKGNDGTQKTGYTMDKPFPEPSEPTKTVVTGKVVNVVDNGLKVAVTVKEKGAKDEFTVVRAYYVYDKNTKTSYPVAQKKQRLLDMYGVREFADLTDQSLTFVRQKAGSNFYYEV